MHKDIKEILYTEEEIKAKCDELAKQIDQDYAGQEILLVGLLKGSVPFMAELAKHLKSDVKFDFMSVSSYSGVESKTLVVRQDIKEDIRGKNVLIVEDILDTGKTLYNVKEMLEKKVAGLNVVLVDERLTTKIAQDQLIFADVSRKKRKKVIDKMAAVVILEGYLQHLSFKNRG